MTFSERIKYYYDNGFWTKEQVRKAVELERITEEEYKDICSEDYIKLEG